MLYSLDHKVMDSNDVYIQVFTWSTHSFISMLASRYGSC